MDVDTAEGNSRLAAFATLATGTALVLAPGRVGWLTGLDDARTARLFGVADLTLVPGLLVGRPRWPWMAARAVLNLPMAVVLVRSPRRSAKINALSLVLVSVRDLQTALALRDTGR